MAADSNMGFRQDAILASALNRHSISFQSGAVNSTSGMFPMGNNSFGVSSPSGISRVSNSSGVVNNGVGMINQGGNSFGVSSPSGNSRACNSSGIINSSPGMINQGGSSYGVTSPSGISRASSSSGVLHNSPGMINQGGNSFGVSSPSGVSRACSSSAIINNNPGMINQGGNSFGVSSPSGVSRACSSSAIINNNPGMINQGLNSNSGLLIDSVPGLKHELELAVEWSVEEQSKLEEGLVKYAEEPSITRYIKIAATLAEKTVRDVALRCRWMTKKENGKRRKPEELYMGKKLKDRKEKLVESSLKSTLATSPSSNLNAYPLMMHNMDNNDRLSCEAVSGTTRHLLGENAQILSLITANLATFKVQDNIDLFCHTRNNITAILNNMRDMPGIMSQMPPLPVTINEELMNSILPNPAPAMMFGSPSTSSMYLKQEPRCL